MSRTPTHYEVLQVAENASMYEVKKGYRSLALLLHPDKGGKEEDFKVLHAAYLIIVDSDARRRYDSTLGINSNWNADAAVELSSATVSSSVQIDPHDASSQTSARNSRKRGRNVKSAAHSKKPCVEQSSSNLTFCSSEASSSFSSISSNTSSSSSSSNYSSSSSSSNYAASSSSDSSSNSSSSRTRACTVVNCTADCASLPRSFCVTHMVFKYRQGNALSGRYEPSEVRLIYNRLPGTNAQQAAEFIDITAGSAIYLTTVKKCTKQRRATLDEKYAYTMDQAQHFRTSNGIILLLRLHNT